MGRSSVPSVDVAERRRHLLVDDPHHLLGRDAVGGQRGDERAGARADVDVELVDRAVDRQQVERAQRADLVDAAGEAAAAEHERGLRAPRPAPARRAPALRRRAVAAPVELDDLAHAPSSLRRRRGRPSGPRPRPCRCVRLPVDAPSLGRSLAVPRRARLRRAARGARPADARRPSSAREMRARRRPRAAPTCVDLDTGRDRSSRRAPTRRGSRPRSRSSSRPSTALLRFGADGTLDTDGRSARGALDADGVAARRPLPARRRRPDARRAAAHRGALAPASVARRPASRGSTGRGRRRRVALRRAARRPDAPAARYDRDIGRRARRADRRPRLRRAARPQPGPARRGRARSPTRCAAARRPGRRRDRAPATAPAGARGRWPTRRLAADGATLVAADQRAVGQLLRRDAAQGPRRALRRRGHDRGGRRGRRARTLGRARRAPARRRRLGALARATATTPAPGRAACSTRDARRRTSARAFEASLPSPGARARCATRMRGTAARGPLPRQDRHAHRRQRAGGYCTTRDGPHARLRVPDERRRTSARARAHAGPDGRSAIARARRAQRRSTPSSSSSSPASSSTATPSRSAFSSFEPGRLAGDDVVGLLRHRAGHAAARGVDPLGRLLARQVGQRAGEHERLAGQRALAGRRALLLHAAARARAGRAISARICSSASWLVDQRRPSIGPMPGVSRDLLRRRRQQRVDRAEVLGEVAPGDVADAPRCPSANSTRAERPLACEASIAATSAVRGDLAEALELDELLGASAR